MKGKTLTVIDSKNNDIEKDTKLQVERHHVNQFTGRETIEVSANPMPNDRISSFQLMKTDTKDVWKEIAIGRKSDTIVVKEE